MQLAPPGPVVPAGPDGTRPLTDGAPGVVRATAAVAAVALGVWAAGDLVVVALLAAVLVGTGPGAVAVAAALASAAARWGSPDLAAVAGAQAVLGPTGLVDPPLAAAGAWCGAAALVLAVPAAPAWSGPRRWRLRFPAWPALVAPAPLGVLAALVVWGPGGLAGVPARVAASAVAVVAALLAARLPAPRLRAGMAVVAGLAALALTVGARL